MEKNYWFSHFVNLTLFVETKKEKKHFSLKEKIDEVISKEIASEKEVLSFNYGLNMRTAIYIKMIKNGIKTDMYDIFNIGIYNFRDFGENIYFIGGFVMDDDNSNDPGDFVIDFVGYMISGNPFKEYKDAIDHILDCVVY